jgi:hypothetical protein
MLRSFFSTANTTLFFSGSSRAHWLELDDIQRKLCASSKDGKDDLSLGAQENFQ